MYKFNELNYMNQPAFLVNKPIVLVGMPGTGKSTVGKKLARKLNLQFYDTDEVIKSREGYDASDVCYFRGEKYFRTVEEEVVKQILSYGTVILSTGSGTFVNEDIRKLLLDKTFVIWLDANLDVLLERTSRRDTRPELSSSTGDRKEILQKLFQERKDIYSQAHLKIDCGDQDPYFLLDIVLHKIKEAMEA